MAKSKPVKSDRQAKIDAIRGQQQSAERRRGLIIVGVCALVALAIVAIPVVSILQDRQELAAYDDLQLDAIGAPASVCQEVETKVATGNQDHVEPGTEIPYEEAPPAFGTHYDVWASMERKFYTAEDRPDVGELVHNLEHGYTVLWYDETVAEDEQAVETLRGIAAKFTDDDNMRNKFKIAPWTQEDGKAFPDGQHIAMTHWSVGGDGDPSGEQTGVWQYCSEPSGAALQQFMEDYPYTDSPEPNAA